MDKIKEIIDKLLGKDKDTPSEGFTLIELLVVIAVIGVLAAALLLAINPLEQVRRAQDSGMKQQVASLGRAVEAYYVNSAAGTQDAKYPDQDTDWLTGALAGEFKEIPEGNGNCVGGAANSSDFCFLSNADPNFVVYTTLNNAADRTRAKEESGGAGCNSATDTYYIYSSALGKAGIICETPTANYGAGGQELY